MLNIHSAIKQNTAFRKLAVSDLLFVEFTCMVEETKFGIWSDNNYFAFISSGKKLWRTIYHSYEVDAGDIQPQLGEPVWDFGARLTRTTRTCRCRTTRGWRRRSGGWICCGCS